MSFENFKGVLLSERPPAAPESWPFVPAGRIPAPLGWNSSVESREGNPNWPSKSQKALVTDHHKHFIKGMDETIRSTKEERVRSEAEEEERKKKFSDEQADLRRQMMGSRDRQQAAEIYQSKMDRSSPNEFSISKLTSSHSGSLASTPLPPSSPKTKQKKSSRHKSKPKWAMTEEEAARADQEASEKPPRPSTAPASSTNSSRQRRACSLPPVHGGSTAAAQSSGGAAGNLGVGEGSEEEDEEELNELLSFAQSLDFEKFMTELEVRQALKDVQDRVDKLESRVLTDQDPALTNLEGEQNQATPLTPPSTSQDSTPGLPPPTPMLRPSTSASGRPSTSGSVRPRTSSDGASRRPPKDVGSRSLSSSRSDRSDATWNSSTATKEKAAISEISEDSLKMAENLLHRLQKMRSVHSKVSLASVIEELNVRTQKLKERAALEIANPKAASDPAFEWFFSGSQPQPVISTVNNSRVLVQRQKGKTTSVQNLPYLYRNPSI